MFAVIAARSSLSRAGEDRESFAVTSALLLGPPKRGLAFLAGVAKAKPIERAWGDTFTEGLRRRRSAGRSEEVKSFITSMATI
jgi:hypothetical protein